MYKRIIHTPTNRNEFKSGPHPPEYNYVDSPPPTEKKIVGVPPLLGKFYWNSPNQISFFISNFDSIITFPTESTRENGCIAKK